MKLVRYILGIAVLFLGGCTTIIPVAVIGQEANTDWNEYGIVV